MCNDLDRSLCHFCYSEGGWEEWKLSWQLLRLSLYSLRMPLAVYFTQSPLSHLLCFSLFPHAELFSLLFFCASPALILYICLPHSFFSFSFSLSIPSSAGWLIAPPQLCGWHLHQSLTNPTRSPETHSSAENSSISSSLYHSHCVFGWISLCDRQTAAYCTNGKTRLTEVSRKVREEIVLNIALSRGGPRGGARGALGPAEVWLAPEVPLSCQ